MIQSYKIPIQEIILPYIPYILIVFVIFCACAFIYFKSKHKFWLNQVITNKYDPRLMGKQGFIVSSAKFTKYFDPMIYSCKWSDLSTEKKVLSAAFLKIYYNYYKDLDVNLSTKMLSSQFEKHNNKCFVSLKYKNPKLQDKICACICSKPIQGRLYNKNLNIYFFDYLCSNPGENKKHYYDTLYTHFKNHLDAHNNKIFLFHTSEIIEIATSLVSYQTFTFSIKFFPNKVKPSNPNISFILLNGGNYRIFMNTFFKLYEVFDCFLHVNINQLTYLLDQGLFYICIVLENNVPLACYFYKNTMSIYNKSKTITLVGSYKGNISNELFLEGFYNSIILVYGKEKMKILMIDSLAHNEELIKDANKYKCIETYDQYYYFYNFAYKSFNKNQVLILC